MLLSVLALCVGLASGGRLGDCLLPTSAADATVPSAGLPVPDGAPAVPVPGPVPSAVPDGAPAVPVPSAVPVPVPDGAPAVPVPGLVPSAVPDGAPAVPVPGLVPSAVPDGAPAVPVPSAVPVPVPSAVPGPVAGPGIQLSALDARRVPGSVSVGSFSSASSFQGPQAGFFQFSSPSAVPPLGFGGLQFSVPPTVCLSWCLSPTGSYFCCRYAGGQCPLVPEVCQADSEQVRLPTCAGDNYCAFGFKCCFDRCHGQFVCKAAVV